ncbi:hypothetical protein SUGI_0023450 [Cryptomeria japonica]|nr:hypothetical protein SUGI_0023450 [Cryptomeria japonica]
MAKRIYAFLAFLLLVPPFTFASVSIDDYGHYDGLCERWSTTFRGQCFDDYHCLVACANEHSVKGKCHFTEKGMACFCYDKC